MNEEENMKIFELIVKEGMLPATIEELMPLSFIGNAAVKFYQEKINLMDKLDMAEDQKRATLHDGQDAGRMLLEIEGKIGKLQNTIPKKNGDITKRGTERKQEQLEYGSLKKMGLSNKNAFNARQINNNPEAVAAVIKEAEENEDIPTKTAVLNRIKNNNRSSKMTAAAKKERQLPDINEIALQTVNRLAGIMATVQQLREHWDSVSPKMRNTIETLVIDIYNEVIGD